MDNCLLIHDFTQMNKEPYSVSICVPVYGVEKYIERCAKSLFGQTYMNIEYVFVDDCTKDHSMEILLQTASRYPERKSRIKIIRHEHNRGLAAARNTAIAAATGCFIMHVDSDDWIEPDAVEQLVKMQMETNADYVMANHVQDLGTHRVFWIRPHILVPRELSLALIMHRMPHNVYGQLFKRSLYTDNCIVVEEGTNMGEDFQQVPRLAYYATKVALVDKVIYHNENTNETSYTRSAFNLDRWKQSNRSVEIISDFCQDKGRDFEAAAEQLCFGMAVGSIVNLAKSRLYRNEYQKVMTIVIAKRDLWHTQPLTLRLCFYLKNIYLVAVYVKIAGTLLHSYRWFRKKIIGKQDLIKP